MKKTRRELIAMVDAVMNASACTMDFESLIGPLEKEFPTVDIGRIIFDPACGRKMTATEIVDIALARQSGGDE